MRVVEERERQGSLPLSREERLALVERFRTRHLACLSRLRRDNLSRLLVAIEMATTSDGCRILQEVLAAKLSIGERMLRTWLAMAEELELIAVSRQGGRERLYRVQWESVRRLGQAHSATEPDGSSGQAQQATAAPAIAEQGDGDRDDLAVGEPGSDECESGNISYVTGNISGHIGSFCRSRPLNPFQFSHENTIPTHSHSKRDPREAERAETSGQTGKISAVAAVAMASVAGGGADRVPSPRWVELSLEVLGDPRRLDDWFAFAVAKEYVRECDRLRVFAAARSVLRRSKRQDNPVVNPPGAFWRIVKRRLWACASQDDEEWARAVLRRLEQEAFQ